ncbi:unnamed protein product, partial [Polarella glacialis]
VEAKPPGAEVLPRKAEDEASDPPSPPRERGARPTLSDASEQDREEAELSELAADLASSSPSPCAAELAERISRLPKAWRGALLQMLQEAESENSVSAEADTSEDTGARIAAGGGVAAVRAVRAAGCTGESRPAANMAAPARAELPPSPVD